MDNCPNIGDVISSPRYGEGRFVVTSKKSLDMSESSRNPNATSIEIHAQQLNSDGSFNPEGKLISDNFYEEPVPQLFQHDLNEKGWTAKEIKEENIEECIEYQFKMSKHIDEFKKDPFRDVLFHGHMTMTFIWESPNTLLL